VVPQVVERVAVQMPCGSGALSATVVQSPRVVVRLQAMHAPVHALSQHTPWAQKPVSHSFPALQGAGGDLRPQEELAQNLPVMHCWSLLQRS
jgi:hypothetical protein